MEKKFIHKFSRQRLNQLNLQMNNKLLTSQDRGTPSKRTNASSNAERRGLMTPGSIRLNKF